MKRNGVKVLWTEARVRAELPLLRVRVEGEEMTGSPVGRCLPFAVVYAGYGRWEFSWSALASSLNSGRPLIV